MSLDSITPQAPINPAADAYGAECLRRSRVALQACPGEIDIAWGPQERQRLDLFAPPGRAKGLPVLVFFHGGGWTHGHKEWCGFMAPAITSFPAILVAPSYRLMPQDPFPAARDDGFAVLRWLVEHVGEYGGDPDRIFVGGHSAGGHLAALLALDHAARAAAGVADEVIKGCFPLCATLSQRNVNAAAAPQFAPVEPVHEARPGSPLAMASTARTPFFLCWGSAEKPGVRLTGAAMAASLRTAGSPVAAVETNGDDHFSSHLVTGDRTSVWTATVGAWMTQGPPRNR